MFATDVAITLKRESAPLLRNWPYMLFGLIQPLLYLGLFVPLLPDGNALQWFVPGMIVMLTLFTTATCGWTLTEELTSGTFERLLATPLSRPAIILGRALKELVPLLVQSMVVIGIAVPFGLHLYPIAMLVGFLLVLAFGLGVAALSYSLAIASKRDGSLFYMVTHSITLPLMLLGGVLLPMESAPRWLYLASRANPLTYLVEAERALFTGSLASSTVAIGAVVALAVGAFGLAIGARTIRRATL